MDRKTGLHFSDPKIVFLRESLSKCLSTEFVLPHISFLVALHSHTYRHITSIRHANVPECDPPKFNVSALILFFSLQYGYDCVLCAKI